LSFHRNGQCRICRAQSLLCESHIIPKFVFKWQKATSPTQYLRTGESINRRTQDGFKVRLLCKTCELSLSKSENLFKSRVFDHSVERKDLAFQYSNWMPHFCVSTAWRGLTYLVDKEINSSADQSIIFLIEQALEDWRLYLLGDKNRLVRHPVHFFDIWQLHNARHAKLPGNWNRFVNRHSVIRYISNERNNTATIFVKMGPVSVFGHIIKPKRKWIGTRVNSCSGTFSSGQVRLPGELFFHLVEEAQSHMDLVNSVSPQQQEVISKSILDDMHRLTSSSAFIDLVADYTQFGDRAFLKGKTNG
jgi:hypothetical protein